MLKVFIENRSGAYVQMFRDNGWGITNSLDNADLLQLEGGADVSPALYGEEHHPTTYSSILTDTATEALYQKALLNGTPIAGICRGSQFLCVMGGGKLWQDVDGHAVGQGHDIQDVKSGMIIPQCSSTHHQQHRPASNAIIIAEAFPQLCTRKSNVGKAGLAGATVETDIDWDDTDVEAFFYPHIKALGYQPHPEFFDAEHPCQKYYFDIIDMYLGLRA